MSTIAGRWDDYTLSVAIDRHNRARLDAQDRSEAIDDEIKVLEAEQRRLGEVANRHHNAERTLQAIRNQKRAA